MPLPHPALNARLPALAPGAAWLQPMRSSEPTSSSPPLVAPRPGRPAACSLQRPRLAFHPAPASVRACGHPRAPGLAMQS